jgi:hypothetical protein
MMLFGYDVLLLAPAGECIADIILRACRQHWRDCPCVFEDAEGDRTVPLTDPWVWKVGTARREFFVYRSQRDADSWDAEGAVPPNANTMFHFLIGDRVANGRFVEVAFVFDKLTPAIRQLIKELRSSFLALSIRLPRRRPVRRAA